MQLKIGLSWGKDDKLHKDRKYLYANRDLANESSDIKGLSCRKTQSEKEMVRAGQRPKERPHYSECWRESETAKACIGVDLKG